MCELKVRVWDKAGEEYYPMHDGADGLIGITAKGDNILFVEDGEVSTRDAEDYIIEPCTWIKDKNGRNIYKGDIVAEHNGDIIGKIVQHPSGEWQIAWIGIFGGVSKLYDHRDWCEVIGNIHENKDLLEYIEKDQKTE